MATLALAVTVAVALSGGVAAYYDSSPGTRSLEHVPALSPDTETSNILLPRLAQKYRPASGDWTGVSDPNLYLLTESQLNDNQVGGRAKRTSLGGNGPSLSIVNPLDVLRQRLLLEIARRRMRQSEDQILANREWLKTIGKRSGSPGSVLYSAARSPNLDYLQPVQWPDQS